MNDEHLKGEMEALLERINNVIEMSESARKDVEFIIKEFCTLKHE